MPTCTQPAAPVRKANTARILVLLSSATWLAGCTVGPDYRMPSLSLPLHWGSDEPAQAAVQPAAVKPAEAPKLSQWWLRLDDPVLTSLIQDAVRGNLDVATAKAKIREARASYRKAGGALEPSVDLSSSASRSRSSASSSSSGRQSYSTQFQAGFDASWELDLFGANRRAVEAAQYGVDAAEDELRSTLLTLIGDVAANYVEMRGYQARIELARRTAASQHETANLTRVQYDAGTSSALDVANAVGQATATEANISAFEASRAEAVHRLGVLLGLSPAALAERLGAGAPVPAPQGPVPTGVPADILRSRPDVRQAERELAQATAKIGEAEAARYPDISLTGSLATSGTSVGDLAKGTSIGWSIGPSLSLPIFDGGQLNAAVEVTQAQRDQSYIAFRSAILTALEDVENAAVSLSQERIRNERLSASAASYREAQQLAQARYQGGTSSFLDVLDAERSLYSAEDSLITSTVAITTDYIALNKALGGGWDGEIDASKPEIVDTDTGPRLAARPIGQ